MPNTVADALRVNPGSIDEDHIHVVAAIVWQSSRADRFLIARRPEGKHLGGYWEFPGGKVESGENARRALVRELREEIGIEVLTAEAFMQVYCPYPERNVLLDTWIVTDYNGTPSAREKQVLDWISPEETGDYRFPPADLPILQALQRAARQ